MKFVSFSELATMPKGTLFHILEGRNELGRVYIRGRVFCRAEDGGTAILDHCPENMTAFDAEYVDPLGSMDNDTLTFPAGKGQVQSLGEHGAFAAYEQNDADVISFYFRHPSRLFNED